MDPLTLGIIGLSMNPGVQQGASNLLGKLPVVGGLFGGGPSEAEEALMRKQQQLAQEARRRQQQQMLTAPRLQGSAQQMLAFNPLNQAMARMYGPEAAFTPSQFAKMVQNPMGFPQDPDEWARQQGFGLTKEQGQQRFNAAVGAGPAPNTDVSLVDYRGTDPEIRARVDEYIRQKKQFEEAERRRRELIEQNMTPLPAGPAPLRMPGPAPARRY